MTLFFWIVWVALGLLGILVIMLHNRLYNVERYCIFMELERRKLKVKK